MQSLKVSDYMNRQPVTFAPEMTIESAVTLLLQTGQRGGPVVDQQRNLVGFFSEQDCLATMLRDTYHNEQGATVADCMYQGGVVTVSANANITDLAQQMTNNRPKYIQWWMNMVNWLASLRGRIFCVPSTNTFSVTT